MDEFLTGRNKWIGERLKGWINEYMNLGGGEGIQGTWFEDPAIGKY